MNDEKYLTTKEAADYLHISIRTFKYWIKNQSVQPVQTGAKGAKFYSEVQLEKIRSAIRPVQPVQLGVQNDELHTSTYATTCAIAHVESLEVQTTCANVNQNCTPDNKKVYNCTPEPVQNLGVQRGVQLPVQNSGNDNMTTEIINNETEQINSNLPQLMLDTPAFFAVYANKVPCIKDWGNPNNQTTYDKITEKAIELGMKKDTKHLAGFDITKAGICVFDFDKIFDHNGNFATDKARLTVERFLKLGTYSEVSVSEGGLHFAVKPTPGLFNKITNAGDNVLFLDDLHDKKSSPKLEIFYNTGSRYILFTGNVYKCAPNTPIASGEKVDTFLKNLLDEIHNTNKKSLPKDNNIFNPPTTNKSIYDYDANFEQAKIERALDYIDPSNLNYEDWLNVGKALKSANCDMSLWDRWSAKDTARYKGINEISYKWNSFTGSGITIATLFNLAQKNGFDIKEFWYEYHNINSNSAQDYSDNETVNSNIFITLYQQKKYKEAQQKAVETLQAFINADNFTIKSVHNKTILTAAALSKHGNFDDISIYEEFKSKCKKSKAIPLNGTGGLAQSTDSLYDELEAIRRKFNKETFEREQQAKNDVDLQIFNNKVQSGEIEKAPLPLDELKVPEGFNLDFQKMVTTQTKFDREGIPYEETIFHSINIIVKRFVNADDRTEKITVATLKAGAKKWTYCTAEREFFATSHKIVSLSTYGFDTDSNTAAIMIKFLREFEHLNYQLIPTIKSVSQTGWRGDEFVYPNNNSGNYQLDDKVNTDIEKIFQSKGDKSIIIDLLKKVKNDDTLNTVIGATLAAPLVKPLNIDNIAVHIYANTGSGKSTISKLALSLFANSYAPRALPSADSTKVGFELFFRSRRDLPALIEDISGVKDERFKKIVEALPYQFVNKVGRLRGTKGVKLADLADFSGTLITNGEKPLNSDSASGGGLRRLIEIQGKDKMIDKDLAAEIADTIRENYGLFGKEWIDFIKNNKGDIKEYFKRTARSSNGLRQKLKNKIPLHIDSLAAIFTANLFFDIYFLGIDEKTASIREMQSILNILQTLPNEIEIADYQRAIPLIKQWIVGNEKAFLKETNKGETYGGTFENYGIERKTTYGIYPRKFKEMLENEGFAAEMVIKQLAKNEYLEYTKGKFTKSVRIGDKSIDLYVMEKSKWFKEEEGV